MGRECARKEWQYREQVVNENKGMAVKLAVRYWRMFPASVRCWVDVEDLVMEAQVYMMTRGMDKYDGRVRRGTFLWAGVENLLRNEVGRYRTQKRQGLQVELKDTVRAQETGRESVETRELVQVLYERASPELQQKMREWFSPAGTTLKRGSGFQRAIQEFRTLAEQTRMGPQDCRRALLQGVTAW